jgi:putative transposase
VLLRPAHLGVANVFALLRLLARSDHDKDTEILVLRHQIAVLQRQLADQRIRFQPTDRALLAALLHPLPLPTLRRLRLLVHPDTVLRWHRDLLKRRHAATCVLKRRGRPPTVRSIRALVLRLTRENSSWGYRRIHGELAALGIKVSASTVCEILREHGIPPAPERDSTTWADFLHSQADALLACDFFETLKLTGRARTSSRSSSTPPGASGSLAPPRTPPHIGWCSSAATWSWTLKTRAAQPGS